MILKESLLKVADNSGARIVKCIQPIGSKVGREGGFLIVSVKKARPGKKVQKGRVYKALIIQCRKGFPRPFGHTVSFRSNRVVLLKKSDKEVLPLGTRISKTLSFELRRLGFLKLLLISPGQL